jgi:hypothetical protein
MNALAGLLSLPLPCRRARTSIKYLITIEICTRIKFFPAFSLSGREAGMASGGEQRAASCADRRRRDRRVVGRTRPAAARLRGRCLRAGAEARGGRRRGAAQSERHPGAPRHGGSRCPRAFVLHGRGQGSPPLEDRRDLEPLRSRSRSDRALRFSLSDGLAPRSARRACRWGAAREMGCDPSRFALCRV